MQSLEDQPSEIIQSVNLNVKFREEDLKRRRKRVQDGWKQPQRGHAGWTVPSLCVCVPKKNTQISLTLGYFYGPH